MFDYVLWQNQKCNTFLRANFQRSFLENNIWNVDWLVKQRPHAQVHGLISIITWICLFVHNRQANVLLILLYYKTWVLMNKLDSGPRFNIKMTSYQYMKSHCGDKTMLRPSYLHNVISYTGKTTSLYWIGALVILSLCYKLLMRSRCPVHITAQIRFLGSIQELIRPREHKNKSCQQKALIDLIYLEHNEKKRFKTHNGYAEAIVIITWYQHTGIWN